jgi:hypothetical protein
MELETTVKIASGGFCVGGANVGAACADSSQCPGSTCGCGVLRNFRCSNAPNKACAIDADCGASNTCNEQGTEQTPASGLPRVLECGGLYTGGGANAVPLPLRIPDTSTVRAKVASCNPVTGQIVTAATTRLETGSNLTCSEGKKCSVNNATCVLDSNCPMSETCESRCFFGAPIPIPNAMSVPTSVCAVNVVATDLAGTGTCDGGSTVNVSLRSEVYLSGDLFDDIPGIQPCPLCDRFCIGGTNADFPCNGNGNCNSGNCNTLTTCLSGPNDGMNCTPGTSDSTALGDLQNAFPTSHHCPPEPGLSITSAIGGLPIDLEFTTGTQIKRAKDMNAGAGGNRVFCGFCRDISNGGSLCFEGDNIDVACPEAIPPADGNAVPCTSDADCADADSYESCAQRNPGAFSRGTATVFSLTGSPAECLADGQAKTARAVGGFCIPPTFEGTIDAAGDLPGPGAVSLEVEAQLVP